MSELTGENPSLIANIETIKDLEGIDVRAKIELIFILLGAKPVTEIYIHDSGNQKVKQLQDVFAGMGIECSQRSSYKNGSGETVYELIVVGNASDLEKCLTTNDPRELGKLYGFPETAVDAYVRADQGEAVRLIGIEDLPEDVRNSEYAPFCQFCFSEKWQEELKIPKQWSEIAKKYAPELHGQFLQEWKSVRESHHRGLQRLSEPIENFQQTPIPTSYELVTVENRWGQALPDNKIRWLDTGNEEAIDWQKYKLVRKWNPEAIRGSMLIQTLHVFTRFELLHIESDEKDDMKVRTKVFGEYKKK